MKITAIIAEYNPFHNGHAYHIRQTCEMVGETYIVCVMSGNFVQRGEPAIADKWARTRMALHGGADMVIELPFLYATQSAEGFALGGVEIVDALNCVDYLSFGSESGALPALKRNAEVLLEEPAAFKSKIKRYLGGGESFPRARQKALHDYLGRDYEVLSGSNDILAVQYLMALLQFESGVEPICVKRQGSRYDEDTIAPDLSSATAIRKKIRENGVTAKVLENIPTGTLQNLSPAPLTDLDAYFRLVQFRLRCMSTDEIAQIYDVSEGLEHRIKSAAQNAQSYWELIMGIKSKRYTYTRITRVLLYCLFGVTKDVIAAANADAPLYARVLGMRQHSTRLLSFMSKHSSIPLLTKSAQLNQSPLLRYDIQATDVYGLLNKEIAPGGRDFTQRLIVL